jgi:pyruvate ferredoxin oxidoreductase delta subunit
LPELVSLPSVEKFIAEKLRNDLKVVSAHTAFDRFSSIVVKPGAGNAEEPFHFTLPRWQDMRKGVSVEGQPQGGPMTDPVSGEQGGFRPARNELFRKYSTRTMRPVVNFSTCTKCTLCWLDCPDAAFDVTTDATYDPNLQACCGCGICEAVCPVPDCITMVNESEFTNNDSQWLAFRNDQDAYLDWLKAVARPVKDRSHGFRYRGQYQEQVPAVLETIKKG